MFQEKFGCFRRVGLANDTRLIGGLTVRIVVLKLYCKWFVLDLASGNKGLGSHHLKELKQLFGQVNLSRNHSSEIKSYIQ